MQSNPSNKGIPLSSFSALPGDRYQPNPRLSEPEVMKFENRMAFDYPKPIATSC
jgi:hypothetical protein